MAKKSTAVKAPQRPQVSLPQLRPYAADGGGLSPDGDYDGVGFEDLDLGGTDGAGATFLDCGLYRCSLDEARWERVRLLDSVLDGVTGVGTDLAGAELRDVEVLDARLGGGQIHGSRMSRVLVRGGKIDFLNLRQATLMDVTFENCVLVEPDFGGAKLERVAFPGCVLRGADFTQATLKDVDLREAAELEITAGVGRLAGAVISSSQLMDLATAFAAEIGVRVGS
ncbi:pentapeptide repeat-containing protein [Streptomyces albidus (ex Kaewkla and Franco 2022)]|uniref:pentapeptide repeat-containing protein n=1 Tax=Streptomyces albidus (ex Kaewkla and Franco 2022) TaxID=722709 RepID=UPI0015EF3BE8|nr:pentapeptide repeat-containing protein [Streptomyces albidus (ex Kaewkla and Franco 2022)]